MYYYFLNVLATCQITYNLLITIFVDLIQGLFDPVLFSNGTDTADETRTYMMFTQFLTEAEGTD